MINLLPPQTRESIKYARRNVLIIQYIILIIVAGLALVTLLFFGQTILASEQRILEQSIAGKDAQIATLKEKKDEAKALSDTIDTIAIILEGEIRFSVLLQEIGSVLPPGATLSSLELTGDKVTPLSLTVGLAGINGAQLAPTVQQNLISSALFSGADVENLSVADVDQNDGTVEQPASVVLLVSFVDDAERAEIEDSIAEQNQ